MRTTPFRLHLPRILRAGAWRTRFSRRHAAQEEAQRLRSLLDAIDEAVFIADLTTGRFIDANAGVTALYGYTREEFLRLGRGDLYGDGRVPEGWSEHLAKIEASGGSLTFFSSHKRKDGTIIPVESSVAIKSINGQAYGIAIVKDMRARATSEAAQLFLAKASEVLASSIDYEKTLDNVAALALSTMADWCHVHLLDPDGTLRLVAMAHGDPEKFRILKQFRSTGIPPRWSEIIRATVDSGVSRIDHISPEGVERSIADLPQVRDLVIALGMRASMIVPIKAHGKALGAIAFVSTSLDRTYGAAEQLIGEDIGARAALAIENATMFRNVQQANRAKDEFLTAVSHELRTPLQVILGWAAVAAREPVSDLAGRALATIERSARVQARIVDDLLDVSSILTGRVHLDAARVDLGPIIVAAVDSVRLAAEVKGVTIDTRVDGAGMVDGDPTRLQQILWNLVSNAIKFTPAGGAVSIGLRRGDGSVTVTVQDTGIGISPDFLPHVFDRFRQEDGSTTRKYGGLGLGLSIVRLLVELHGGAVDVESAGPGRGASFTVTLPEARDRQSRGAAGSVLAAPQPDLHLARPGDGFALRDRLVLVVDDNADLRELISVYLIDAGAKVLSGASAEESLALLASSEVDAILIDLSMPGTDGFSLLKAVRSLPDRRADTPAIAFTAHAGPEIRAKVLAAGFNLHVPKPVTHAALLNAVASVIRSRSSRA